MPECALLLHESQHIQRGAGGLSAQGCLCQPRGAPHQELNNIVRLCVWLALQAGAGEPGMVQRARETVAATAASATEKAGELLQVKTKAHRACLTFALL